MRFYFFSTLFTNVRMMYRTIKENMIMNFFKENVVILVETKNKTKTV